MRRGDRRRGRDRENGRGTERALEEGRVNKRQEEGEKKERKGEGRGGEKVVQCAVVVGVTVPLAAPRHNGAHARRPPTWHPGHTLPITTHMHTHIQTHTHVHTFTYTHTRAHTYAHTLVHAGIRTHIIYKHIHTHTLATYQALLTTVRWPRQPSATRQAVCWFRKAAGLMGSSSPS